MMQSAKELFDKAEDYYEQGKYQDAIFLYENALALNDSNPRYFLGIANAFLKSDQNQKAIEFYGKAVQLKPDFLEALYSRGKALEALDQNEEALADYDKFIALQPNFLGVYYDKISVLNKLNRKEESISVFQESAPIRALMYYNRGIEFEKLAQFAEAMDVYDEAILLKPNFTYAHWRKGNVLDKLCMHKEAINEYKQVISLQPCFADAYFRKAKILSSIGSKTDAIDEYNKAIAIKPNFTDAYYNKSDLLADLGDIENAISTYDKGICTSFNPYFTYSYYRALISKTAFPKLDYAVYLFNRVKACKGSNKQDEALRDLKAACKLAEKGELQGMSESNISDVKYTFSLMLELESIAHSADKLALSLNTTDPNCKSIIHKCKVLQKTHYNLISKAVGYINRLKPSDATDTGKMIIQYEGVQNTINQYKQIQQEISKLKNVQQIENKKSQIDMKTLFQKTTDCCKIFFAVQVYENPILNKPNIFNCLISKFSLDKVLELGSKLGLDLLQDPELAVAGMMSLGAEIKDLGL